MFLQFHLFTYVDTTSWTPAQNSFFGYSIPLCWLSLQLVCALSCNSILDWLIIIERATAYKRSVFMFAYEGLPKLFAWLSLWFNYSISNFTGDICVYIYTVCIYMYVCICNIIASAFKGLANETILVVICVFFFIIFIELSMMEKTERLVIC